MAVRQQQQYKKRLLIAGIFAASIASLMDLIFFEVYRNGEAANNSPIIQALAQPTKFIIEKLGGGAADHYSNTVYAWWTVLYLISFTFAFLVFFVTLDKTYFLIGLSSSFMIILVEDYMYYVWKGESPSWDGPFNWGFLLGWPLAYYLLFFLSLAILFIAINRRRERRFWRLFK